MLKILAVIGWILLALLIFIVWVMIIPRNVYLEYSDPKGLTVKVRAFLFKIKVYPVNLPFKKKDKPKREKQPKEKKPKPEKAEGTQQKETALQKLTKGLPTGMDLVKEVLGTVRGVMSRLLGAIKIKDVAFTVPIYAGDAYQTQKQYALITESFYTFSIFLQKYVKIEYKKPVFVADFANLYSGSTYFYCKIQASPCIILTVGFYLLKKYLSLKSTSKKEK